MTFKELNISEPILKALTHKKYEKPTPVQEQAIPVALGGRDLLGIAQTGTGKTAAFAIPIIQQLNAPQPKGQRREVKALILTPTRELAIQIDECFSDYARYADLRHAVIFGGVNQKPQVDKLRQGADVLIATPGRLLDLIGQRHVGLNHIRHFVLDEADRMLDMGFIHDIKRILPLLPKRRQTLFFSATMPASISNLAKTILCNPAKVEVAPVASVVDTIDQYLYFVEKPQKSDLLIAILKKEADKSVLVFSRTKHGADKIARVLNKKGIGCEAIHGNKTQVARQRALTNFKSGKTRIIIATDIAARGIDIANLEMVINYDLPDVAETYVHRIGRTGRAGNSGTALTFCSQEEHTMVKDIQKLTGKKLNAVSVNTHG
jgi:ATP-dependent RNA helicase RhlE